MAANALQLAVVMTADPSALVAGANAGAAAIGKIAPAAVAASAALDNASAAADRHAHSQGNVRAATVELESAIHRTIDSLSSGLPLTTILTEQGEELALAFGAAGGVAGVMEALLNPLTLVFLGIGVLSGAFRLLSGSASEVNPALEAHKKVVEELRKAYQESGGGAAEFAKAVRDSGITVAQEQDKLPDLVKTRDAALRAFQKQAATNPAALASNLPANSDQGASIEPAIREPLLAVYAASQEFLKSHDVNAFLTSVKGIAAASEAIESTGTIGALEKLALDYKTAAEAVDSTKGTAQGLANGSSPFATLTAAGQRVANLGSPGELRKLVPDEFADPNRSSSQKLADELYKALQADIGKLRDQYPGGSAPSGRQQDQLLDLYSKGIADIQAGQSRLLQGLRDDSRLATEAILARTLAEKTAIAAEKARTDSLRESHDQLIADTRAEAARNQLLAEAAKVSEDYARQIANEHALVGLTPYEQELERNRQRHQQIQEQTELPRVGAGGATGSAAPAGASLSSTEQTIMARAIAHGVDPNVALAVYRSEGAGGYVGDHGSSFGPFQLHYGGIASGGNAVAGLGDDFTGRTGLDARDPSTTSQQIDYVMAYVAQHGWSAFHGAAASGIGNWQGIGAAPPSASGAGNPYWNGGGAGSWVQNPDANAGRNANSLAQANADTTYKFTTQVLTQENQSIDEQSKLLAVQTAAFGKSAGAIGEADERQKLLTDITRQHIALTPQLIASVDATAEKYGKLKQAEEDAHKSQQLLIKSMDDVRDAAKGALSTLVEDMQHGASAGKILQDVLGGIQKKLLDVVENKLVSSLFGASGTTGGGAFGGGIGSLFGSLFSPSSSGGGVGTFSNGFGAQPVFGFADGGVMTPQGPRKLPMFAGGGTSNGAAIFGERGIEAAVPLPDGRSIPVTMKAPTIQSDSSPISVHVTNNHPTGQVESVKQSRDPSGGRRLDLTFSDATAGALHGPAGRKAMAAYGVAPPLVRRG